MRRTAYGHPMDMFAPRRPKKPKPPTNLAQAVAQQVAAGKMDPAVAKAYQGLPLSGLPGPIDTQDRPYQAVVPPKAPGAPGAGGGTTAGGAPSAPGAPGVPSVTGTPASFPGDSTYAAAIAQLQYDRGNKLTDLTQQGVNDNTDYAEAIRRMQEQRPIAETNAKTAANNSGLFFSGALTKQLETIGADSVRQQSDAQQAYDRRQAAREAARQAIEQGFTVDQAAAAAAAVDRQLTRDQAAAASGALAPPAGTAPAKPKTKTPAPKTNGQPVVIKQVAQPTTGTARRRRPARRRS